MLNLTFLSQLNILVKALITMPTTRTVIFVSDGFNRFPGRELYAIMQGFAPKDRSLQFNPRDMKPELDALLKLATRYDVKFYTIDSRGLYIPSFNAGGTFDASTPFSTPTQIDARNPPSEATSASESVDFHSASAARENADLLAGLAHETGGLFFENNNDLSRGFTSAFADGRQYYVLAYISKNTALDGKYRKITVVLNDEDKYHITAKSGYWAAEQ